MRATANRTADECALAGPAGQTVRDICKVTGADIKSWTDPAGARARPTRTYVIEVHTMHSSHMAAEALLAAGTVLNSACCGVVSLTGLLGPRTDYELVD